MNVALDNRQTEAQSTLFPIVVIGVLFFIFGFVTWLNGSLIPFLTIACELNQIEAYLVTMSFYLAYTFTALPMALVLKKVGYRRGMTLGLIIMALGAFLFIPAAQTRVYGLFLSALFVLGTGLTVLQTAANPYIVHIGPKETAAVRISIMGLLNKAAGVVAPIVFTAYVLSDMSQFSELAMQQLGEVEKQVALEALSSRLTQPYLILGSMLIALAMLIRLTPLPEITFLNNSTNDNDILSTRALLRKPHLLLGVISLFCYVGVEVIAGDTIGLFGRELGVSNFTQLTSYTMAFMVLGYILGIVAIPRWISQEHALMVSALLGIILSVLVIFSSSESSSIWQMMFSWTGFPTIPNVILFLAALGFANAMVWPAVWPLALRDLGEMTSTGSALLIMGISGGAIFPFFYGMISEFSGDPQLAYGIMIPCYVFILFYALKGCRL